MPGKLRRRRRGGEGIVQETPETSVLPLLEASALDAGVPGALGLAQELEGRGYYEHTLLEQWRLVHDCLREHLQEAADPVQTATRLSETEEARVRFFVPGVLSALLADRPEVALELLLPLAADEDRRVGEAVQAFGVRPFAHRLGPEVVAALDPWLEHGSPYVRRAAVEGTRPRGVWVKRLAWAVESPALLLPILERLRDDPARIVANALGNCLNDLSKDHPRLALDVVSRWLAEPDPGPCLGVVSRKALRTLMKEGDPRAMRVLGFGDLDVKVTAELVNGSVVGPNSNLRFELEIENRGPAADAILVYEIETPGRIEGRARRKRSSAGSLRLPGFAALDVRCRERIFDTRAAPLIAGACRAQFFLNGAPVTEVPFELRR